MKEFFTFNENESRLTVIPDVVWKRSAGIRKIRLLLTDERLVLLSKESARHLCAELLLLMIAIVITAFLLLVLHVNGGVLPLVLLAAFLLASNIHLQYRFRNPRLHRIIRAVPLDQITLLKAESNIRLTVESKNLAPMSLIMLPRELCHLEKVYQSLVSENSNK